MARHATYLLQAWLVTDTETKATKRQIKGPDALPRLGPSNFRPLTFLDRLEQRRDLDLGRLEVEHPADGMKGGVGYVVPAP